MTTNVNISAMSPEERAAIELDKQRWKEAHYMLTKKSPNEIRTWLNQELDEEYREDIRRRLNKIRQNQQERIKNNVDSASHKRRAG